MIPAMMKAAVARAYGQPLQLEEVPVPQVVPGRILVRVAACGVCHTDLHAINGDWPVKATLPLIPGHEGVGTVVAVGTGVTQVKIGDRVGVPWLYTACGHCEHCHTGWETLCPDQQNTGYSVQGSYAEYVLADPNYVGHLPDGLSFEQAAPILCAGVTVYKGLKETEVKPGQWVVISGIGGLGHLAVQYAKAMGMRVAAVDIQEQKLALAKAVGADLVINAAQEDPVTAIHQQLNGAHGVLVTAVSRSAFAQAVGMLRRHGTLSLVGLPPGTFDLDIFDVVLTRKTVRGSIVGTRQDLVESLAFAAEGKVKVHYHLDRLENINGVLADMAAGRIDGRVVLRIAEDQQARQDRPQEAYATAG
ncbi:propanol-preferring alcohol dehydrogenase [Larkinella arboricola]|uniref:alcohol dehydrogenase n=1 Tax=Larkinella arboricola TaxID=643671 RepID=A0A327WJ08_LARAB|nr:alcohol dehydrogenase AdhP [Larkinella arboricola]RAJ89677.1 propanol-preferring alcohol dehydrogenase [Larkinella arboricola]